MTQALWFASRACGLVALLSVTVVVALGALHTGRVASRLWPRYALQSLHRNLAPGSRPPAAVNRRADPACRAPRRAEC
jgi:sulfoxide reductase heme-binding subunit YedZ